jgi:hypothetical protein
VNRFFALVFFLALFSSGLFASDISSNKKGLKLYKDEKYKEAARNFSEIKDRKNKITGNFNKGAAEYKDNDFEKAQMSYFDALRSGEGKLQVESLYNLGNTKFHLKDIPGALSAYQSALDLCGTSAKDIGEDFCKKISDDIRNNMQYVFKVRKQNRKNNKNKDKDRKNKQDRQKDQDKEQDKQDNNKEKQNQSKQEQKDQKNNRSQQDSSRKQQKMNISPQQARQLLNIINSNDSDLQKKLLKKKEKQSKSSTGKDW